jgi:hypothetical protein
VGGENRAVSEVRLLLGEQPLEPQEQGEVPPPLDGRLLVARLDLDQSGVEGAAAGRSGCQGLVEGLAFKDETLAGQLLGTRDRVSCRKGGGDTHKCLGWVA